MLKDTMSRTATVTRTAADIRNSLGKCDPTDAPTRAFGVEATIDLHINFAYDRADLTPQGLEQARELGRALSGSEYAGKHVTVIGHTDVRGDDAYNDALSMRRAGTVKDLLVNEFRLDAGVIRAEGRGKRELIMSGTTEQDHALNRRVQVKVE
jgi:outer membrane protein OmpA-like peptidoglycan-associated protein